MKPPAVVEPQPIDHLIFCLTACREAHSVQPLDLQRTKERFGHGVIPAISLSAHRTAHAEGRELLLEVAAGVLAACGRDIEALVMSKPPPSAPRMSSNACMRSSSAGSRRKSCCSAPKPPPCSSGRCSPRARSRCERSTDGRASPKCLPLSSLTSPLDRIASCRWELRQQIATQPATGARSKTDFGSRFSSFAAALAASELDSEERKRVRPSKKKGREQWRGTR